MFGVIWNRASISNEKYVSNLTNKCTLVLLLYSMKKNISNYEVVQKKCSCTFLNGT